VTVTGVVGVASGSEHESGVFRLDVARLLQYLMGVDALEDVAVPA
jgi:hypothetical protein